MQHWLWGGGGGGTQRKGIGMSTMEKEAISQKCLNTFVPHCLNAKLCNCTQVKPCMTMMLTEILLLQESMTYM